MIRISGEVLPPWEERLIRERLEGGGRVPPVADCDGCSGGCPDSWPPWRPMRERIYTRDACAVHDFHPRYEGGTFPSLWHRAAARWEGDGELRRNWRKLPELEPYRTRFAAWHGWERRAYMRRARLWYWLLRGFGWLAAWVFLLGTPAAGMIALAIWCAAVFSRVAP